jgi:PhnB protein
MLSYGESAMAHRTDPRWHGRILHAILDFGGVELTGVGLLPPDFRRPQGFYVMLTFDEPEEASRVFTLLADGGEIGLPFQPTFWSPGFGVLVDTFGIAWEINSALAPAVS